MYTDPLESSMPSVHCYAPKLLLLLILYVADYDYDYDYDYENVRKQAEIIVSILKASQRQDKK